MVRFPSFNAYNITCRTFCTSFSYRPIACPFMVVYTPTCFQLVLGLNVILLLPLSLKVLIIVRLFIRLEI